MKKMIIIDDINPYMRSEHANEILSSLERIIDSDEDINVILSSQQTFYINSLIDRFPLRVDLGLLTDGDKVRTFETRHHDAVTKGFGFIESQHVLQKFSMLRRESKRTHDKNTVILGNYAMQDVLTVNFDLKVLECILDDEEQFLHGKHMLVLGGSGRGKSTLLHNIVAQELEFTEQNEVQLVIMDPSKSEFQNLKGKDNILVLSDAEDVNEILKEL